MTLEPVYEGYTLRCGPHETIDELQRAASRHGRMHFAVGDYATVVEPTVYAGRYFITSSQPPPSQDSWGRPKVYRRSYYVKFWRDDGEIECIDMACGLDDALAVCREIAAALASA